MNTVARVCAAIAAFGAAACARGIEAPLDLSAMGGGAGQGGSSTVGGLAGSFAGSLGQGGAGGMAGASTGAAGVGVGTGGGGSGAGGSTSGGAAGSGGSGVDASGGAAGSMDASVVDVVETGPADARPDVPCPGAGTAISFNAAQSQTVVIPGAAIPSANAIRTIEMWILSKSPSSNWAPNHTPFEHGGQNSLQAFAVDLDAFATTQLELYVNPAANSLFFSSGIGQDTWFHVAAVYDGTKTHAIVNGVEKGTLTPTGGALQTPVSSLYVGSGILRNYFTGSIDEVRVWNVARTAAEVARDMNFRLVGNEPGLVGYYRFDEGSGTVARDSSGANNGTLTNGPTYVSSGVTLGCR